MFRISVPLVLILAASAHAQDAPAKAKNEANQLKKFDKNGDGKLDDEERAARTAFRKEQKKLALEKYDANGDGKLDAVEKAKRKADKKESEAGNEPVTPKAPEPTKDAPTPTPTTPTTPAAPLEPAKTDRPTEPAKTEPVRKERPAEPAKSDRPAPKKDEPVKKGGN